mmetsp:Transcript_36162/g.84671  ORF Transcript_36162/g.84671 Transcript_36162/m.84671 type:complete len:205 (-) Transcript_36162:687-1301(-)
MCKSSSPVPRASSVVRGPPKPTSTQLGHRTGTLISWSPLWRKSTAMCTTCSSCRSSASPRNTRQKIASSSSSKQWRPTTRTCHIIAFSMRWMSALPFSVCSKSRKLESGQANWSSMLCSWLLSATTSAISAERISFWLRRSTSWHCGTMTSPLWKTCTVLPCFSCAETRTRMCSCRPPKTSRRRCEKSALQPSCTQTTCTISTW